MSKGQSAFDKRLRRRVIGREQDFFAVVTPGLEPICQRELRQLGLSTTAMATETGGVHFSGKLPLLYTANLHLRTAGRILMRVAAFKASHFSQLEKGAAAVDWALYLKPAQPVRVHVTTRRCRLYHKGAVGERILGVIAKQIGSAASGDTVGTQRLFVRGVDNRFTLSLDSSGSMLHKRGIKQDVGRAPIRETLAAGALMMAEHLPEMPVVDPMCGSGTFSLEAAMMAAGVPPGWHRDFAFFEWPSFSSPTWRHIRKIAGERMAAAASAPTIFASDMRADAVVALKQTAAQMGVGDRIAPAVRDFFSVDGMRIPGGTGTLVLNPPFGRRLGRRDDIFKDYHRIGDHLRRAFPGWRVALFCPAETVPVFTGLQLHKTPVPHGGLRLILLTGRIPG